MRAIFYVTGAQGSGKSLFVKQLKNSVELMVSELEVDPYTAAHISIDGYENVVVTEQIHDLITEKNLFDLSNEKECFFFSFKM